MPLPSMSPVRSHQGLRFHSDAAGSASSSMGDVGSPPGRSRRPAMMSYVERPRNRPTARCAPGPISSSAGLPDLKAVTAKRQRGRKEIPLRVDPDQPVGASEPKLPTPISTASVGRRVERGDEPRSPFVAGLIQEQQELPVAPGKSTSMRLSWLTSCRDPRDRRGDGGWRDRATRSLRMYLLVPCFMPEAISSEPSRPSATT